MFITLNRYKSPSNGNIQPIFSTLRFHLCYSYQEDLTHSFLPRTPFLHFSNHIVLTSRPSTLPDTMWIDLLPTLLLLQNIAVQAQLPPMPKSAHFTQIRCDGITQSRNNQIALFDGDGKSLGSAAEGCSLINPFPCKLEGLGNITVGPYIVSHPRAFFGACFYKDVKMEIIATDGINTVKQQLFAVENHRSSTDTTLTLTLSPSRTY